MYANPFSGISDDVKRVVSRLILPEDEYHYKHTRRFARTIQVILDQKPRGRLLEIGTSGVIPAALKELSPSIEVYVTNFDPNINGYHLYTDMEGNEHPGFSLDLEYGELPVKDGFFDWVICCEVIEHMEIDPMFMLSEANRIIKPKGHLLITTPNATSSHALLKMSMGLEPYFYMQYNKDRSYHRHNYEYSAHTLGNVLSAAGFSGKIWTEDSFENGVTEIVKKFAAAGFDTRNVGDNIFAICTKESPVVNRYPKAIYV
jgi:ubiquinone/menaquinone biosynthesis C-methylase UbiE